MIFIDTGYFIATLDQKDKWHSRAKAWGARVRGIFACTEHVLWETVNHFSAEPWRSRVHSLVSTVLSSRNYQVVRATSALFDAGMALHRNRTDKSWSLTDCISFVVMEQRRITQALAYDQHFEQAGFEALLRHDPP